MTDQRNSGGRRSGYVAILLVGAAAGAVVAGLALRREGPAEVKPQFTAAALDPAQASTQGKVYPSLDACIADLGAERCVAAFNEAEARHNEMAPRFDDLERCRAEFGPDMCRPMRDNAGHSWFAPALMGVLVGQMLSGGQRVVTPVFVDGRGFAYYGAPGGFVRGPDYYRDRPVGGANVFSFARQPAYAPPAVGTPGYGAPSYGSPGGPATSVPQVARPAAPARPAPSEPVARGGFGSTGSAHASGGAGAGE